MAKVNQKTFKNALVGSGGNQSSIAKKIGVTRGAISIYLNKNPKMRELLEIEAERIIDVAENIIDADITKERNIDSAKWKLINSKRGKRRGYGPKLEQQLSGNVDNKIQLEIIEVTKKEDELEDENADDSSLSKD